MMWELASGKHDSSAGVSPSSQPSQACQLSIRVCKHSAAEARPRMKNKGMYFVLRIFLSNITFSSLLSAWNTFRIHLLHENRRQFPIGFPPCTMYYWMIDLLRSSWWSFDINITFSLLATMPLIFRHESHVAIVSLSLLSRTVTCKRISEIP